MDENSLEHVHEAGWSRFKIAERFIRRLVSNRANFSTANNCFVIFRWFYLDPGKHQQIFLHSNFRLECSLPTLHESKYENH